MEILGVDNLFSSWNVHLSNYADLFSFCYDFYTSAVYQLRCLASFSVCFHPQS